MIADQSTVVYLSLGSNLGDRQMNLEAIQQALPPAVNITEASSLYQTEPWGFRDQPAFLNQVLEAETGLQPLELLAYLKGIERSLGRIPSRRFGPRTVDIDILFYGDQIIEEKRLIIPHPRFRERAFVLVPLAEISPNLQVPGSDETISDLLREMNTDGVSLYQE